jgi:hypothetical protein
MYDTLKERELDNSLSSDKQPFYLSPNYYEKDVFMTNVLFWFIFLKYNLHLFLTIITPCPHGGYNLSCYPFSKLMG